MNNSHVYCVIIERNLNDATFSEFSSLQITVMRLEIVKCFQNLPADIRMPDLNNVRGINDDIRINVGRVHPLPCITRKLLCMRLSKTKE